MRKDSLIHNPLGIPSIQIGRDPFSGSVVPLVSSAVRRADCSAQQLGRYITFPAFPRTS
jgi:hypothetical protein